MKLILTSFRREYHSRENKNILTNNRGIGKKLNHTVNMVEFNKSDGFETMQGILRKAQISWRALFYTRL